MHEMPIAAAIVEQAVEAVERHGATRIEAIEVVIGKMRMIVPEALQMAFSAVSEGTIAEGAVLQIEEVPIDALCRVCGHRFEPEIALYLCPKCEQADVEILSGNDMILKSVTAETPEEQQPESSQA